METLTNQQTIQTANRQLGNSYFEFRCGHVTCERVEIAAGASHRIDADHAVGDVLAVQIGANGTAGKFTIGGTEFDLAKGPLNWVRAGHFPQPFEKDIAGIECVNDGDTAINVFAVIAFNAPKTPTVEKTKPVKSAAKPAK
tara:strand:- start:3584 stop:4006 length:423 start_codon:yes stop_codon:yes gene_type:complete